MLSQEQQVIRSMFSTQSTFSTTTAGSDLFISEYIEGSSNNKYIEIYNPTAASVNLSNYRLRLYANGASTASPDNVLSGSLASGATIVYENSAAAAYGGAATSNTAVNFNGNDAVELFNISKKQLCRYIWKDRGKPGYCMDFRVICNSR